MPDTDRWWPGLADITGIEPADARFDSHEKRCETNRLELIAVLERAFLTRPADHWRNEIDIRQLSADVIEDYAYPANDAQAMRNEFVIEGGDGGKSLGFPLFLSETPARGQRPAPSRGQDTGEVLRDLLGCTDDEIERLRAEGIVS
jgi:crotonobetainyl-CoA:carnitine CoA-transferase CaiB-like acyl-CoA transferase